MDILISSNLERLLFELTDHDSTYIVKWMNQLKNDGRYTVDPDIHKKISNIFWSDFSTEVETLKTIEAIYKEYKYVIDTHTAVGVDVYDKYVISTGDMTKTVIASTASPFKFNASVVKGRLGEDALKDRNEFELLDILSRSAALRYLRFKDLDKRTVKHKIVCSSSDEATG